MTAPALTPTRQAVADYRARLDAITENQALRQQVADLTAQLHATGPAQELRSKLVATRKELRAERARTTRLAALLSEQGLVTADVERLRKAVEREPVWATVLPISTIRFIFGWQT